MIAFLQRPSLSLLTVIALLTICLGCGYHFRATGEPVGIKYESLAIPLMTSTSSNIGFEADFTRIIREEFISHAKVPFVPEESAQAVLTARIYDIKTEPVTYNIRQQSVRGQLTTHEVTRSRRLRIRLDIRLTDRDTGKVIWHEKSMAEEAGFMVGADPLTNRYNQQQALEKIARRMAKKIYLKTMERF